MGKALAIIGFRNRGPWTPGMELRENDRCQIGKSWVIAKEDHVAGESFAEDADKWYYLVDARGLDDLDDKLAALTRQTAEAEAATLAAKQATSESREQTQAAIDATGIFTEIMSTFDHDTYLYAITDVNGLVVWGIKRDGSVYQPKGIPEETRKWLESLHTLEEIDSVNYLYAISDSKGNVLWGIKPDGSIYQPRGVPEEVEKLLSQFEGMHPIESDDYAFAIVDANDHVMFAIDHKGATVVNALKGVCSVERFDSAEFMYAVTDSEGNLLYGIRKDGRFYVSKFELPRDLAEQIAQLTGQSWLSEDEKDMEFIYRIEDKDGKVVFGIFYSGDTYMPKGVPVEVRKELDKVADTLKEHSEQIQYVKEHGKDWSNETSIHLPIPPVPARIEITSPMSPNKYTEVSGTMKYADFLGNSFEKPIISSKQGNISGRFDKPNESIDILLELGNDEDTYEIQFGNWPVQDSFHLKAYYSDFWKVRSLGVYKLAERIALSRPYYNRRPWDRILGGAQQTNAQALKGGIGTPDQDMHNGGLGHPDGFPVMLYWNGNPMGLYTLNLKKHKDNYFITKNDDEGKQLFIGDYMTGVFERYNNAYWQIQDYNFRPTSIDENGVAHYGSDKTAEKWDATKGYDVNTIVYDEDTFDFEVGGRTSSVTVRRLFKLANSNAAFAGYEYDEDGYICQKVFYTDPDTGEQAVRRGGRITDYNTMRPQYVHWKQLEVRNPKKTVAYKFAGNDPETGKATYRMEYYDYDSPGDFATTGVYEPTHEPVSAELFKEKDVTSQTGTGEKKAFTKKEYNRSVNMRRNVELYSWIIPIIESTLSAQNLADWGFETEAEAKKAIFEEHHDIDFANDFFLLYNLTACYDSITHNTLYTMYDGQHLVPNHYDTDISMGMSSTYINSFPSVASTIITAGHTFTQYLWNYFKAEIKTRWAALRDTGVLNGDVCEAMVWRIVKSIGMATYEQELKIWPDQPSYRAPVYWKMPAGALKAITKKSGDFKNWGYDETLNGYDNMPAALKDLYDADPASVEYDATKQYVTSGNVQDMYCVVTDGDTVHWYQCTAACKGMNPTEHYTCGNPPSGGVYDSPRRTILWLRQRLAYMDNLMEYTPSASAEVMEAIQGAVANDDDIMALFGH